MGTVASPVTAPRYVPRFVYYVTFPKFGDGFYRVTVVELNPSANLSYFSTPYVAQSAIADGFVKQVLIRTKLQQEGVTDDFERVGRVVTALNNMDMALQAAELEPNGIQNLFNQLWSSDL